MFKLTKTQQGIVDFIEGCWENVLLLGKPGVGKSVITNHLNDNGVKQYQIAAPTGLAAINVNGKTLHSLFKIPVFENGIIPADFDLPQRRDMMHLSQIRSLIIDEVSMVRADMLDHINRVLQDFHNNTQPFGGVQVVLVGDFCQLAPVCNAEARAELKRAGYASEFAFDAHCFQEAGFKVFLLNEVLRQKDDLYFMEILDAARFGNITKPMLKDINDLVGVPHVGAVVLTATNSQADTINANELRKLPEPEQVYRASVAGTYPPNLYPLPDVIRLRVGAQVMVRKNGADRDPDSEERVNTTLVNGTLGIVRTLEEEQLTIGVLHGKDITGWETPVYRQSFERTRKEEEEGGKWVKKVIASFNQLPVTPAWAISMHKSQGQTFDQVTIDPSKVFAAGQLYVALSRARTMGGIVLTSPVDLRKFTVNKSVKAFYESL